MKNKLAISSLRNIAFVIIYVFLVAQLLNNGELLFGNIDNSFIGPFAMLLLFVASAAIVGGLVFGQAVLLFLDGKRKDSIKSAIYSVGWLLSATCVVFFGIMIANLL